MPFLFFPFSAKTHAALSQKLVDMLKWLEEGAENYAAEDISYTLVQGRSHFSVRLAVVAKDGQELKHTLSAMLSKDEAEYTCKDQSSQQRELSLPGYADRLLQELRANIFFSPEEVQEKLGMLANFYMRGYDLDWGMLFEKRSYHRIPLPTYPFIGESYWIGKTTWRQSHSVLQSPHILLDKLRSALSRIVSHMLKIGLQEIDSRMELSEYGFDSITFTELANYLNRTYQLDLTPALFFEYSTLEHLAQYLHTTYASVLLPYFIKVPAEPTPEVMMQAVPVAPAIAQQQASSQALPILSAASAIAIIGMSGAFPQSPDVQSLWRNLLAGRDCISEIPPSRWDWQSYGRDSGMEGPKTSIKWAGIVEEVALFDPLFFSISPREAEQMDPQQRLLMMYVWKAIEDAGYAAASLSGSNTALFVGTTNNGYSQRLLHASVGIEGYSATSQTPSLGPGRISYFLNLHGPSEAVETACSSSLVAIQRGVSAIESGQCDIAIVGGVNTLVSPELHISYSKAGMLCEDGRCKPFSAAANGYVRSEGIGILVLKKLSAAEQDGDHIYGVIRSSAENHGGRANSLTAPNPRAQADLLLAAYHKAGIDPRTVSYIEAHGTGTASGDPIEINGLKMAFKELAQAMGEGPIPLASCGIGSVKSNIGHLELAAGVAGVIKMLLQMQHKKLVKSLYCDQLNPYIRLEDSPFYIVQETCPWVALCDHAGNPLPRRAGVSSFGFGGANAHVVLEEYVPEPKANHSESMAQWPALIVLSARNEERLREQVQQVLTWVQEGMCTEEGWGQAPSLRDLAYTLQVGREALEERLALHVSSLAELAEKLHRYLQEPQREGEWYRGQVGQQTALFSADEELQEAMQEAIGKWLQRGKYEKLLAFWVKGLRIEWQHLYRGQRRRRISLPTYPFARESYWIPLETSPIVTSKVEPTGNLRTINPLLQDKIMGHAMLHPLVQHNISTLWEQQFSSTFYGEEFFLADHVVREQRIMPAVAYLEMARAAVALACGLAPQLQIIGTDAAHEPTYLSLSSVVWVHPLVVGKLPITIHITLQPQDNTTLSFLISHEHRHAETGRDQPQPLAVSPMEDEVVAQIYCQGRALLYTESHCSNVDLTTVQARCQQQISATAWYQRSRLLGISYGPAHQGIEQLSIGADEVLALLRLPTVVAQTHTDFVLHPSILDAALQVCIGLLIEQHEHQRLQLPFALDELEMAGVMPTQGWAWARRRSGGGTGSVFDIEVCDDAGHVALSLRGLSTRQLPSHEDETQTVLLTPIPGSAEEEQQAVTTMEQEALWEKARAYFKKQLAAFIELPVQRIESSAPLEDYGIDSIMAIHFTNALEHSFGPLSKTLLFEHLTINSVTEYFLHNYLDQLRNVLGSEELGATTLPQATQKNNGTRWSFTRQTPSSHLYSHLHHRLAPLQKGFPTNTPIADGRAQQDKGASVGDIAIIGMAGRYPGARDLHAFWENLRQGRDCITEIPPERWDYRPYFDPDKNKPGTTYCKWGGFLDGVDQFDALFFNISPREAERIDPQERLFLECAFATLEDAGYTRERLSMSQGLAGNVGVFVGVMYEEYQLFGAEAQMQGRPVALNGLASSIANRVSYFCNFHGPSLAVDTMCSSSLTAIHLACQSIQQGGCGLAIAGGVNASLHPNKYLYLAQSKFISSQGHCESFGQGADGYVPAEGVGAILLKPLAQAEADGDHVYGVIKATAINHGGKTNGYTVPNPHAQAGVIERALKEAAIDPRTISYVEAHGTGTVLGDPIEIAGLARAWTAARTNEASPQALDKQYCAIGSVKSNIGHAESAAGIAGVTKVLLQMCYGQLVPSLHTEVLNPHIDWSYTPFVVQRTLSEWKRPLLAGKEVPRRAGISSFGAGGSNAHVVLEEYVEKHQSEAINRSPSYAVLIVLSARTREQLHQRVQQLLVWIQEEGGAEASVGLHNLAYTLQMGREAMEERLALQISSLAELEEELRRYIEGRHEGGNCYRGQAKQHDPLRTFAADEDGQKAIAAWMSKGKYEKLLELWVNGGTIDWEHLYAVGTGSAQGTIPTAPARPRRISLPTYPFARERYWIPISSIRAWSRLSGNGTCRSCSSYEKYKT